MLVRTTPLLKDFPFHASGIGRKMLFPRQQPGPSAALPPHTQRRDRNDPFGMGSALPGSVQILPEL